MLILENHFKLHTDASVLGLEAVLYQVHDGVEKVISYTSRSLTKSETKYPVHKLRISLSEMGYN